MKKIFILLFLYNAIYIYAQSTKISGYVDDINQCATTLDNMLEVPNWGDTKYTLDFKSKVGKIESTIRLIKTEDPNYDVTELEKKHKHYKDKYAEGRKEGKAIEEKKQIVEAADKYMVKDEGITNAVHEKNVGKIVFSDSEIPKENPEESKFKGVFSITSSIYLRIYLKTSIFNEVQKNYGSEAFDKHVGLVYKIYLDNELAEQGRVEFSADGNKFLTGEQLKIQTSISGVLNFNKDALMSSSYIDALIAADTKLTEGNHALKIELYPIYTSITPLTENPIASGELTLIVTKGFVNPNNANICMPNAKKSDTNAELKYKDCVKKYLLNNNKNAELKKFVLLSTDWEIRKDDITGIPISKTMYGAAGLKYSEGKCKYETFAFTQNWNGSSYSSTIETSSTGENGDIFCDCIK